MKNETVTLSRELAWQLNNLLRAYFGNEPPCVALRAALADPVPPAGGEPEVLGYGVKGNRYMIRRTKGELLEMSENYTGDVLIELVDRARVTRLQAEVERQTTMKEKNFWALIDEQTKSRELQSELTKARELLFEWDGMWNGTGIHNGPLTKLRETTKCFLAHQSAPATQDEPGHIGTLRRDADERIVFDAVGDPHIKVGMPIYAEQPEPVAVVLPERAQPKSWNKSDIANCDMSYIDGWNDCLDEVARLNTK